MEQQDAFTRQLRTFPTNPAAQEAFIERSIAEARLNARSAVALWQSDDTDLALNAESFLRSIDDLAILPLLETAIPVDASDAASYIDMLVEPEMELRRKVLARLDTMLQDRRSIPLRVPPGPPPEEQMKPRRVCDEAYIAMRSLIHFGEDLVHQFADRDKFLSEPEALRDAAIRATRQSATWQRALGNEPE